MRKNKPVDNTKKLVYTTKRRNENQMKKFKIKEILKADELKTNLELIFEEEKIRIKYLEEEVTEEISYNEITKIKYVGDLRVGIFVGNVIYGYFESEFVSKLQYKKFVENLKSIMRKRYEIKINEVFSYLKHPVGQSYIFLKEAIIIYAEQFDFKITIGKIYKMIAEKYNSKEDCVERDIRYAIQKLYDKNEEQKKNLPLKKDEKISNLNFIVAFVEEFI